MLPWLIGGAAALIGAAILSDGDNNSNRNDDDERERRRRKREEEERARKRIREINDRIANKQKEVQKLKSLSSLPLMQIEELVDQYLDPKGKKDVEDLLNLNKKTTKYRVTCLGLYNGGKSTLLNALTNSLDDSRFATEDRRCTKDIQEYYLDGICYVDAPGLDAEDEDDEIVLQSAARDSDINLFIHNINTGELTSTEKEYLENIRENWGDSSDFLKNTIFVLSRKDETNQEEIKSIEQIIHQQIKDIFHGTNVPISLISLSAKNYIKGQSENKSNLTESSNISQLQELIEEKRKIITNVRQSRMQYKKEKLQKMMEEPIKRLEEEIRELEDRLR